MVKINGKETAHDGIKVSQLLEKLGYKPQSVAVECNEEIVPKSQYDTFTLNDGDSVEIVSFVGGG